MKLNLRKGVDFGLKKAIMLKVLVLLLLAFSLIPISSAHTVTPDTFVRVVSSNPDSRTYTFSCRMDPENNFLRDWYIRPDDGNTADDPNEAAVLDKKSGEFMTYTFNQNSFYHIGCIVVDSVNSANQWRGDLHLDLRLNTNSWNPQIVPLSGNGLTSTLECRYSSPDYSASWEVVNAQTHTRSSIGTGKTITHTVTGHGLYDYVCNIADNTNGARKSTGLPVEYFDQGAPYFPDKSGVPDGIKNVWNRDGTTAPPPCSPTTETCDSKDNDCDGQIDENNVCSSTPPPSNTNCFSNVQNIPATCEGTISGDSMQGSCRVINCNSGSNSMQIKACDKPDGSVPQYFEMYRQTFAGTPLKVCIGSSCIKNEGYVKSQSYPICTNSVIQEYQEDFNDGIAQNWNLIPGFEQPASFSTKVMGGVFKANISSQGFLGLAFLGNLEMPKNYTATARMRLVSRVPMPTSDSGFIFVNLKEYPNGSPNQQYLGSGWRQNQDNDFFLTGAGTTYNLGHIIFPFEFDESQWHMIKIVKIGTNFKLFINDILGLNETLPTEINGGTIGLQLSQGVFEIDDLTVSKKITASANPTPITNTTSCFSKVQNIPATCTDGSIVQDTYNGCRTVICSNGGNFLRVLACDKPDGSVPQYFEMYRQAYGGAIPKICIGSYCVQFNGYVKSGNYQVCT